MSQSLNFKKISEKRLDYPDLLSCFWDVAEFSFHKFSGLHCAESFFPPFLSYSPSSTTNPCTANVRMCVCVNALLENTNSSYALAEMLCWALSQGPQVL